jgi:hypothetical protein
MTYDGEMTMLEDGVDRCRILLILKYDQLIPSSPLTVGNAAIGAEDNVLKRANTLVERLSGHRMPCLGRHLSPRRLSVGGSLAIIAALSLIAWAGFILLLVSML